ncbi:hypothetical protein T484DRAFT_1989026 [Baffinella frigidus]|nr:hypothetical protein T484DRAFT_1989026 [Cryptophyta sp. CCMP2293]
MEINLRTPSRCASGRPRPLSAPRRACLTPHLVRPHLRTGKIRIRLPTSHLCPGGRSQSDAHPR